MQTIAKRPLVIGLPGSFDSADYSSYRSWLKYLPELGVDVRVLDMLQLPGVKQIARHGDGASYYCDWQPDDYLNLITSTLADLQPSQVVLLGFGSGMYEAMRCASALTTQGQSVAGVVGIAPHPFTYSPGEYSDTIDPIEHPEVELCEGMVVDRMLSGESLGAGLLSCVRYEDLHKPHNGAKDIFYIPKHVPQQYGRLSEKATHRRALDDADGLLRTSSYAVPTAFIAAADSWYVPSERVSALARRSRRAPTSYTELPGVCYDFRAYSSQVERVTEAVMDKVGQLLTTGTVRQPRPSHTLLARRKVQGEKPMGTIVLSSARPPFYHTHAIELAKSSKTDLAVLTSHDLDVDTVVADMTRAGVKGHVIDMPDEYTLPLTADFATNTHPRTVDRKSNLSAKRNIGLLYGYLTDQKLFFLDDDIRGLSARNLQHTGAHLDHYAVAGFMSEEYPDNSAVCHANRLAGSEQPIFISGSSLGVDVMAAGSFFPNIYNEDWLFCNEAIRTRNIALLGGVRQLPYNPFVTTRAASEEFGDVLAEGLNYLFTTGGSIEPADESFWRYYLWRRRMFIADVAKRLVALPDREATQASQALMALGAAKDMLATFTPDDFVSYIRAWRDDNVRWRELLSALPKGLSPKAAMEYISKETGLRVCFIGF
jgi:pimeloyl-ACP methyl ester carboxylesterase